jgi:cyclophilin family peptidyl-prolyl cis-trans isomerase
LKSRIIPWLAKHFACSGFSAIFNTNVMHPRSHFSLLPILCLCGTSIGMAATIPAPAAPTNFKVKAVGINSFQLSWTDNSNNEGGWEILAGIGKTVPRRYTLLASPNATSHVVVTNDLPGKVVNFQIRAYNGAVGLEKYSAKTPVVTVTAPKTKTFEAPTNLKAANVADGRVILTWADNSTSESGYVIECKETSAKDWVTLPQYSPGMKFKVAITGLAPAKKYSFRVRAFRSIPLKLTAYSKVVNVTTKALQPPTGLVATPVGEGVFSFKWKDRSFAETGYELQYKGPKGGFTALDPYGANINSVLNVPGADLDANYQFRVRAFRIVGTTKTYTSFAPTVSVKSKALIPPTTLVSSVPTDTSVTLTWKSASKVATGYQVQYRQVGTTDFTSRNVGKVLTYKIDNLVSGKLYEFKVRAYTSAVYSAFSASVQALTKHGFIGGLTPPIVAGNRFLFPIQTSFPDGITNLTVTGLPAGLVYNALKKTITGTLTTAGSYTVTLTVTFADGTVSVRSLILNSVTKEPINTQIFSVVTAPLTKPQTVSLTGKFGDPDTSEAVRVTTTKGTFDIILFADATPKTVENFFKYTDAKSYENSFFHRAPTNFVVQGGGFTHTTTDGFKNVPTFAAVVNEPGLSNVRGTVAMAKLGGQPDSATSQFFVNVIDSTGLDSDNGGFTVFGRVPVSGMSVVDSISALPTGNYNITVGGEVKSLGDVPIDAATAPVVLDPAKLVKITSVADAPILTYTAVTQNASIATATVTGTNVVITGVSKGITSIQVTATDLDGLTVSQPIQVSVP